jgi:HD-GYP domain-containing protein (c-di-GMP phosphodiesterase class II)
MSGMIGALVVTSGRSAGKRVEVTAGRRVMLGRSEACDFQVVEDGVSRSHCMVENAKDGLRLTDLGSSNGTAVNGRNVSSCRLNDMDEIAIGMARVRVEVRGEPAPRVERRTTLSLVKGAPTGAYSQRVVDINHTMLMAATPERAAQADLAQAHAALQTLCRVGGAINAEHDIKKLFETIIDSTIEATGAERAALLVRDPNTGGIDPACARHRGGRQETELRVSSTVVDEVLRKGVSTISTDASADDRFKAGQSIIMQQIRSVMCVPLASKEYIIGALYVDTTDARRKFGDRDLELLAAIGAQAGVTIERARLIENLESLFIGAIRALVAAVEARDAYTHGHSERVTAYSQAITEVLGLPAREREIVELSGLLHDVGKIGVPEAVLNKPGKLDDAEFAIIKLHPAHGAEIVRNIRHQYIDEVSVAVRHHHERWDGRGYPDGLPSERSCRASRILAVADTYDAMTSDRPYRKGFPAEKALGIMREVAGSQLDPELVSAFNEAHASGAIASAAAVGEQAVRSKYAAQSILETGNFGPAGHKTPPGGVPRQS